MFSPKSKEKCTFYTFDRQMPSAIRYFKHCTIYSKPLHNIDLAALVLDLLEAENFPKLAKKDLWQESYLLQLGPRPYEFTRKGL